jgi:hypothetical protein
LTPLAQTAGPSACGPERDAVVTALEVALEAYAGGDIETARAQAALAAALLEHGAAAARDRRDWPQGNARQIRDVLWLYDALARGSDADRDAGIAWIDGWIRVVEWLNGAPRRLSEWRGQRVDYDPFTRLVRRIGDVAIDYDPFTHQIRRLGDVAIDYDPFTRAPRRIGDVAIDYDPFDGRVRRVAGIAVP